MNTNKALKSNHLMCEEGKDGHLQEWYWWSLKRADREDALHLCILPLEQLTQFIFLYVKVNEL